MNASARETPAEGEAFNPYQQFDCAPLPLWLLRRPEVSFGAKAMYARLMLHASTRGRCWPGAEKLAEELGIKRRQSDAYLRELRAEKLIEITPRGRGRTGVITFLWHKWMSEEGLQDTATLDPQDLQDAASLAGQDLQDYVPQDLQDAAAPFTFSEHAETEQSSRCAPGKLHLQHREDAARKVFGEHYGPVRGFLRRTPHLQEQKSWTASMARWAQDGKQITSEVLQAGIEGARAWCEQNEAKPGVGALLVEIKNRLKHGNRNGGRNGRSDHGGRGIAELERILAEAGYQQP